MFPVLINSNIFDKSCIMVISKSALFSLKKSTTNCIFLGLVSITLYSGGRSEGLFQHFVSKQYVKKTHNGTIPVSSPSLLNRETDMFLLRCL